ncbi:MAG: leucyl/phenylalanyl-tRNA--protein transferase, partial [Planctomycetota bacterium]
MSNTDLDPETLLSAYAQGAFPMTDSDGVTRWYTADPRGILPLEEGKAAGQFHVARSLRQVIDRRRFDVTYDTSFEAVMRACMADRDEGTWISEELVEAYVRLHGQDFAHSVEVREPAAGARGGGVYGVSIGGGEMVEDAVLGAPRHQDDTIGQVLPQFQRIVTA